MCFQGFKRWLYEIIRNVLFCFIAATCCQYIFWLVSYAYVSQNGFIALIETISFLLGCLLVCLIGFIIFLVPFYSIPTILFLPHKYYKSMEEKNINGKNHLFIAWGFPVVPSDAIIGYREFVKKHKWNFGILSMACLLILMFLPINIQLFCLSDAKSIFLNFTNSFEASKILDTTILLWGMSSISLTINMLFYSLYPIIMKKISSRKSQ